MNPAVKALDNMSASEWANVAAMTSGLKEEKVLDVKPLADQIINEDFQELLYNAAEKYPEWAKENGLTADDLNDGLQDGRFFGYMRESVCEYIADTARKVSDGFHMTKDVYSGTGSVFQLDRGAEKGLALSLHDLSTEIIENCIETVLDDNNIDIPDEDRTNEEGESNIYGRTFSDLCDAIESRLVEAFEPLKDGIDRIDEPKYEYTEQELEERE